MTMGVTLGRGVMLSFVSGGLGRGVTEMLQAHLLYTMITEEASFSDNLAGHDETTTMSESKIREAISLKEWSM